MWNSKVYFKVPNKSGPLECENNCFVNYQMFCNKKMFFSDVEWNLVYLCRRFLKDPQNKTFESRRKQKRCLKMRRLKVDESRSDKKCAKTMVKYIERDKWKKLKKFVQDEGIHPGMERERGSERRKSLHWKVRTSKVSLIWSQRRKSKRSERRKYFQNVENHFVEKNVESKQMLDFQCSEIFWRHR